MTPAAFLALTRRANPSVVSPRLYAAVTRGAAETFLTFHTRAGRFEAPPYSALHFISGDEAGGTAIQLNFGKLAATLQGRHLVPVFDAIRTRTAAHLHEFRPDRHDPPPPGEPVITELTFAVEQPKPRSATAT